MTNEPIKKITFEELDNVGAVNQTKAADKKVVESINIQDLNSTNVPLRPVSGSQEFAGADGFGESEYDMGVLPTELKVLGKDYIRASKQSGWEQAGRSISGGIYKGLLTAVEDVAYLADFENNAKRLAGLEEVDTNIVSEWAKSMKDQYDKNHPIYRYNPGETIDLSDPGFYWSAVQGIVDSAVGFGAVGAGAGATVGRGIKYLSQLGKLSAQMSNAMATAGTALTTNYAEGKMMALEMFTNVVNERMKEVDKNLFNKALEEVKFQIPFADPQELSNSAAQLMQSERYQKDRQKAEQDIRSIAGDEANKFQLRNMAFMASDAFAINGMFRGAGLTRNLQKAKNLKNTAWAITKQAPVEYIEEVGQSVAQQEGEYQAKKAAGMDTGDISSDPFIRTWDALTSPETQLEGMMGLFGGPVQHVLVQSPTNIANRKADQEYYETQQSQIEDNKKLLSALFKQELNIQKAKSEATKRGDTDALKTLADEEFRNMEFRNFQMGTTEDLESHLKEIQSMSPQEAEERGYTEDYATEATKRLGQLKKDEKLYLNIFNDFQGKGKSVLHPKLFHYAKISEDLTPILNDLKRRKDSLYKELNSEIETLSNTVISQNEQQFTENSRNIVALENQKQKAEEVKEGMLRKPNAKLERARFRMRKIAAQLDDIKANPENYQEVDTIALAEEYQKEKEKAELLVEKTKGQQTKNKRIIKKANKIYQEEVAKIDRQIESLKEENRELTQAAKEADERVEAISMGNTPKAKELFNLEAKYQNYLATKRTADKAYQDIVEDPETAIKEIKEQIEDQRVDSGVESVENAESLEDKKEAVEEIKDLKIKQKVKDIVEPSIKEQEKRERLERTKTDPTPTTTNTEELNTEEEVDSRTDEVTIDDDEVNEIEKNINEAVEETKKLNAGIITVDKTKIEYAYIRSEEGASLLAYRSRDFQDIILSNSKVVREEITNELNENMFKPLLNPNKYNFGTEITIEVDKTSDVVIDAKTGQTWSEVNIEEGTDEYYQKVPMLVKDSEDNVLGYLHQNSWIDPKNVFGNIEQDRANLLKIRKAIIDQKGGTYKTTITSKSIGYFMLAKDGPVKVSEAIKDENIELAVGGLGGQLFSSNPNINSYTITNKNRIKSGYTYMMLRVGQNEDGNVYTAMPVINSKVSDSDQFAKISDTIINAISIYFKIKQGTQLSAGEKQVQLALNKEYGVDLGSYIGLSTYLNQFVYIARTGGKPLTEFLNRYGDRRGSKTVLAIDASQISFINKGTNQNFINPNSTNQKQFEAGLAQLRKNIIPNLRASVGARNIENPNIPVIGITMKNGDMVTETIYDSYKEYVRDNTETSVIANEVDQTQDGQSIYSYTIQPKVVIDFEEFIGEEPPSLSLKEATDIFGGFGETTQTEEPIEDSPFVEDKELQDRGINVISSTDEDGQEFYQESDNSPRVPKTDIDNIDLDAELRDLSSDSLQDEFGGDESYLIPVSEKTLSNFEELPQGYLIDGLTSEKQDALIDLLYQQAVKSIVQSKGESVNIDEVYTSIFNSVEKSRNERVVKIKKLAKLREAYQSKGDSESVVKIEQTLKYNMVIKKTYDVYVNNQDTLKAMSNNKLNADGIFSRTDLNEEGELSDNSQDVNEKIYTKSSYEEDASDKASKEIKRFLADIRDRDFNGEVKKNFLGLSKIMQFEEVYRQVQVVTAGLVPDFDVMLSVLRDKQKDFPFFIDLVNKLENDNYPEIEAIRNEFVFLMNNHYSKSKFVIYRQTTKDGPWSVSVMDSNANSIENAILEAWSNAIYSSSLVSVNDANDNIIDSDKVEEMLEQYDAWKKNPPETATPEVKQWLSNLGINLSARTWDAITNGDFNPHDPEGKMDFKSHFTGFGIFTILATQYLAKNRGAKVEDNLPTNTGIVRKLASLDRNYTINYFSNSHREGLKTVFSYGTNKYLTDLIRDIKFRNKSKDSDGNEVFTNTKLTKIAKMVFSRRSTMLKDMLKTDADGNFITAENGEYILNVDSVAYQNLDYFTVSLEAIKQQGSASRDNRELNKLSPGEIEFAKLAHITAKSADLSNNNKRIINILYPTTSDKSTVMGYRKEAVDIEFNPQTGEITDTTIDMLYDALVLPEIERIKLFQQIKNGSKNANISEGYKKAGMKFNFLSALNELTVSGQYKSKFDSEDPWLLFDSEGNINPNIQTEGIKSLIKSTIKRYVNQLVEEKMEVWEDTGIINSPTENVYIDKEFFENFQSVIGDNKIKGIATDMVIQYLVGNAESFKLFIGDPAMFEKTDAKKLYDNVGKRLASDIAPGEQGDGTTDNSYVQGFMADRKAGSEMFENYKVILGEKADAYGFDATSKALRGFDSTDAQEYTSVLEHLYVMNMHGKIRRTGFYGKVKTIIETELKNNNYNYTSALKRELSSEEYKFYQELVFQPMKPVYVENLYDENLGIMRRVYIKSSSFPLTPELTEGTELDKLRLAMEKDGISRLAFSTATKLGNVNKPINIFKWENKDGDIISDSDYKELSESKQKQYRQSAIIDENIEFNELNTLSLPRSGFRIQQEVPYDPFKEAINKVSQASKNLFINMLGVDGFQVDWLNDGNPVNGTTLRSAYMDQYNEMFKMQRQKLVDELDFDEETGNLDIQKLKAVLKREAVERNYPLSDVESIDLDEDLKFLAFSPSASKFEALLNSIVTNRVLKMKFPGKSYVLGSEEGFRIKDSLKSQEEVDYSKMNIVFTEAFNGESLQAADGKGSADQIFIAWDFSEPIENFIDPNTNKIDPEKLPKKLLERYGMRIPNQGPNSQSYIEIAGFLPKSAGDLIIAPKEYVVRMGSDFDVDKLYLYKPAYFKSKSKLYSNFPESDEQIEKLRKEFLDRLENMRYEISTAKIENKGLREEIDELIKRNQYLYQTDLSKKEKVDIQLKLDEAVFQLNIQIENNRTMSDSNRALMSELLELLDVLKNAKKYSLWNKIFDVHTAIHKNPDPRVQSQIHTPLDFWKLDTIADDIQSSITIDGSKLFTGLSDEYQKQKFMSASAGKVLVGVFSNDSMFNAVIQGFDVHFKGTKEGPFRVQFGNSLSTGDMSLPYTIKTQKKLLSKLTKAIDKERADILKDGDLKTVNPLDYLKSSEIEYKSEVISGFQSAAVDNEKEQILNKINANSETAPVIKVMAMLGFGEEIPYYLSLPIIKDYVEEMQKLRGLGEFVVNVEQVALDNILSREEYNTEYFPKVDDKYYNSEMSLDNMKDIIKGKPVQDSVRIQKAALHKYLDLKNRGRQISKLQSLLNMDSQGLGKSYMASLIRQEEIAELGKSIANTERLISDETIPGSALMNALPLNNKLWSGLLPYYKFTRTFQTLEQAFAKTDSSRVARTEFRESMWKEIKSFKFSDPNLLSTEPITDSNFIESERRRLTINTPDNVALAKIIKDVKNRFPDNRFLQVLNTRIMKNASPSTIDYKAAVKQFANESRIYEGFIDLLKNERNLGKNGEPLSVYGKENYTTRDLFQDLIWYSYLTGGIQEAKQFVKFIPYTYLFASPFVRNMKNFVSTAMNNDKFLSNSTGSVNIAPQAVLQIIQNNVSKLPKAEFDNFKISDGVYTYKEVGFESPKPYYAIRDDKKSNGSNKFRLLALIGEDSSGKSMYQEIPTRGTTGKNRIPEYNYLANNLLESIYTGKSTSQKVTQGITMEEALEIQQMMIGEKFKSKVPSAQYSAEKIGLVDTYKSRSSAKEVIDEVLENIKSNSEDPFNRKIADLLSKLNFSFEQMDIQLNSSLKTKDKRGVALGKVELLPSGKLRMSINIGIDSHNDRSTLEHTILHELIHVITKRNISNPKTKEAKQLISDLKRMKKALESAVLKDSTMSEEYKRFKKDKTITSPNDYIYYALASDGITEFTSIMVSNKTMQNFASNIDYNQKSSTLDKFLQSIVDLLNSLGLNIKKDSLAYVAIRDTMKLATTSGESVETVPKEGTRNIEDPGPDIPPSDASIDMFSESDLPAIYPNRESILEQFGEKDKVLKANLKNAEIMSRRAEVISANNPYYNASYGTTIRNGNEFYKIQLSIKPEMNNLEYRADLVSREKLEEIMKRCK